jgi:hypothetical protein
MNSDDDEIRMTNANGMPKRRNPSASPHFQLLILASHLIRHSTFVLRHFTIRVHLARVVSAKRIRG